MPNPFAALRCACEICNPVVTQSEYEEALVRRVQEECEKNGGLLRSRQVRALIKVFAADYVELLSRVEALECER